VCVANDDKMRDDILKKLQRKLKIREEGELSVFLGVNICRNDDGSYTMDQKNYIMKMAEKFRIDENAAEVETPMVYNRRLEVPTEAEKRAAKDLPFQSLLGGLIYAVKTRPDVAYAVSDSARFMCGWGVDHFKGALRILKYLYSTRDHKISINPGEGTPVLYGYCDANYGDDRNDENDTLKWKSQGGYIMFLNGAPVSWRSQRHKTRCLSSMEAEYMEASEAGKEVIWLRELLAELDCEQNDVTTLYEDNKACIAFSSNNTSYSRTKHIDIRAYWIRDLIKGRIAKMEFVSTKDQLADMMTKAQLKHVFIAHVQALLSGKHVKPETVKRKLMKRCACVNCFAC
jgi:hypothetical protein